MTDKELITRLQKIEDTVNYDGIHGSTLIEMYTNSSGALFAAKKELALLLHELKKGDLWITQ